ncbi:acetolactate decarboxylase [Flavobacteriaceae bacterium]|mgnify:FL=1|jgi:acetolactate decarboxylase|nr:acetolactate decarboxylase [Flavobacteriaceae bacterium]
MRILLIFTLTLLFVSCNKFRNSSSIEVVGQMRDVMWKGDLVGKVSTDSLNHPNAYGLGPIENLKGEVLLFEGQTFISKVIDSVAHQVSQVNSIKAPFFVYSKESDLNSISVSPLELSLKSTEELIDSLYFDYDKPLLVRVDGVFKDITVHSVNLPEGSSVSSPEQAHKGLTQYNYKNLSGSIVGFFSRKHKAIFTHHDSFLHAHFISNDRNVMGHVDSVLFHSVNTILKVSK